MQHHPKPWWYRLAERLFPERCREIPEAQNPERIVLRQFAIVKRYCYLQQFASGEDPQWFHSHQWRYTIALGLWGSYSERRKRRGAFNKSWTYRVVRAPYLYAMDDRVIHQVTGPTAGHTSVFIGLFRDDDLKRYWNCRTGYYRTWEDHIKVKVKRI